MKLLCVRIAGAIVLFAIALFSWTLVHALWYAPQDSAGVAVPAQETRAVSAAETPVRLQVPSVGIDANVESVGVDAKGNMAVPYLFADVAWYQYGTAPGRIGSAVIDGHVDDSLGLPAVFKRLSAVKAGDTVSIMRENGTRLDFTVTDVKTYPYDAVPPGLLFERADAARLNLITCGGTWLRDKHTYDHRIVVYTRLIPG